MSDPGTDKPRRMSRVVKLGLMGAGAAAVLYSCAPGIGGGIGGLSALPYLWFFSNPFYRPQVATPACPPGDPACQPQSTRSGSATGGSGSSVTGRSGTTGSGATADAPSSSTTSQRSGFGSSATSHGTTGS